MSLTIFLTLPHANFPFKTSEVFQSIDFFKGLNVDQSKHLENLEHRPNIQECHCWLWSRVSTRLVEILLHDKVLSSVIDLNVLFFPSNSTYSSCKHEETTQLQFSVCWIPTKTNHRSGIESSRRMPRCIKDINIQSWIVPKISVKHEYCVVLKRIWFLFFAVLKICKHIFVYQFVLFQFPVNVWELKTIFLFEIGKKCCQ